MPKNNPAAVFNDIQPQSAPLSVGPKSSKRPAASSHMSSHDAEELGRVRALKEFPASSKGTVGTKYRFRAEYQRDAELFLRPLIGFIEPSWSMVPLNKYFPDVGVVFTISKKISPRNLLWLACSIVDGHVLVQTLEKENEYTGDRDYFRKIDVDDPKNVPSPAVLNEMKNGMARYVEALNFLLDDAEEFASALIAIGN